MFLLFYYILLTLICYIFYNKIIFLLLFYIYIISQCRILWLIENKYSILETLFKVSFKVFCLIGHVLKFLFFQDLYQYFILNMKFYETEIFTALWEIIDP